ncbi:MAG: hypothetical protein N2489_04820 [Clostridia bacterium]|nr:hypothetical protein [Clostridia bacterium]
MRVSLVTGKNGEALRNILEKDGQISITRHDNSLADAFRFYIENDAEFDILLLIDQGIGCSTDEFVRLLKNFIELIDSLMPQAKFIFITKETTYSETFRRVAGENARFQLHYSDKAKIPVAFIKEVCLGGGSLEYSTLSDTPRKDAGCSQKSACSVEDTQLITPDFAADNVRAIPALRPGISRAIAITGHRGSGVSGTLANLAVAASMEGLSTFIVDLDLLYRSMNLYFRKFGDESSLNTDLKYSLVKCAVKPDACSNNSCMINDQLYVSTLAYSIGLKDKLLENLTAKRLIALLTSLKARFNLVLADIPLPVFRKYPDLLAHVDRIGLCMNNSLYSIVNSVKCIDDTFDDEDLSIFKAKTSLILTKYNSKNAHLGKALNPQYASRLLGSLDERLDILFPCAGAIPFCADYDMQVDTGKKLCSYNSEYRKCYTDVLKNLA